MILLQINVSCNWGSTGKIAEQIGLSAISHGWESHIAYGRMNNPSKSNMIKVGRKIDPYIHYIHDRLFDMEGRSSKSSTHKLVEQIKRIKPDIIQLHNIHDHFLNYQILFEYLNQTEIKVVWTFHDCWAFTGHCPHFVLANCMRWQTECKECPLRNKYIDRSGENFRIKKCLFSDNKNLTIVPCSEWMGAFVKQSFLKEKRIQVIHNGIDLSIFKPSPKIKKDDLFRIIAVSNIWLPYKGLNDIFKLREMLSDDYEIIMVGLTKGKMRTLKGIRRIQHTQNIQELVALYNEADVLINPTYADTFPTVNLESLACGTPVITYRTGGSPEAVDEKTGIVVAQGDIQGLAQAIIKMKKNPLSAIDCRKRAEQKFDKNICFEKYIRLYNSLLQGYPQPG